MLLDGYGLPIQEPEDFASPAALAVFAATLDSRFQRIASDIADVARPELAIATLSANKGPFTAGQNQIDFDTLSYQTHDIGYASWGIMPQNARPGIYHCGVTLDVSSAGAITAMKTLLRLRDFRGPRLLNDTYEYVNATTGAGGLGTDAMNCSTLFAIHAPERAEVGVWIQLVGAGNVTALAGGRSQLWIHRVRGLEDV